MKISTIFRKIFKKIFSRILHIRDVLCSSNQKFDDNFLNNCEMEDHIPLFVKKNDELIDTSLLFLSHYFDLLGSGWVKVHYGMQCRGFEGYQYHSGEQSKIDTEGAWLTDRINRANVSESTQIWKLVDKDYEPIDWQLDFKSGYRWSEKTWYKDIKFGHLIGVDIKVPWELARMQHLPQFALAYSFAKQENKNLVKPEIYLREFRNQVLDFIATNPPRWGVNWACTMDVAIRAVNWLVTYDLFKGFDAQFDVDFEKLLSRSIHEHGNHIIHNLEWDPEFRGNHYLSDIVGLLFVAAYLPCRKETDAWLAFSIQELIKEVKLQFNEDGSNFEASTSYHRLSAELVIYATALVLGLPDEKKMSLQSYDHKVVKGIPKLHPAPLPLYNVRKSDQRTPFPDCYFERLEKMAEFTIHVTQNDGLVIQIGDNDSGRLLKLFPAYQKMTVKEAKERYLNLSDYQELSDDKIYWMENGLDHRHIVAAINGLFDRPDFTKYAGSWQESETKFIEMLSNNFKIPFSKKNKVNQAEHIRVGDHLAVIEFENLIKMSKFQPVATEFMFDGTDLREGLRTFAYPDFGLFVMRSNRMFLSIRCGSIGQNGYGGHAHNDQLSISLEIDEKKIITDPGTYIYTAFPKKRNAYRSIHVHFTPSFSLKEPSNLNKNLFLNDKEPHCEVLYFSREGFLGRYFGYGIPIYRNVKINANQIFVFDFSPFTNLKDTEIETIKFSPDYGKIIAS